MCSRRRSQSLSKAFAGNLQRYITTSFRLLTRLVNLALFILLKATSSLSYLLSIVKWTFRQRNNVVATGFTNFLSSTICTVMYSFFVLSSCKWGGAIFLSHSKTSCNTQSFSVNLWLLSFINLVDSTSSECLRTTAFWKDTSAALLTTNGFSKEKRRRAA